LDILVITQDLQKYENHVILLTETSKEDIKNAIVFHKHHTLI